MTANFRCNMRFRDGTARFIATALIFATVPSATVAQTPAPQTSPELRWQAHSNETPRGMLCTVGVRRGETIVGFTAMNSREYRGFAIGLIPKATRATWRVDNAEPFVVDGVKTPQGAWLTEPLPAELLSSVANGSELAVTSADGDRIVVGLDNARDAVGTFNDCRYGSGGGGHTAMSQHKAIAPPSPTEALRRSGGVSYACAFRMSEVDGVEVARGMMSDRAYLRTFEVTRASITFDIKGEQFFIGDRPVEGAEFTQPSDQFPEGAVTMPFSTFYTAVSLVAASGAGRGLSAQHQAQLEGFMKEYSGATAQVAAPNRHVVFDAVSNGRLAFFDYSASGQPVNFSKVTCNRL